MELTLKSLKELWKIKDQIFRKSSHSRRFDEIDAVVDSLLGLDLDTLDTKGLSDEPFGPAIDGMTADRAFEGVERQAEQFEEDERLKNLVLHTGAILGGFDFDSHAMKDEYRIISNTFTGKDDFNGSLTSQGQSRHPSSHIADNNYFFTVASFLQACERSEENILEKSKLVLRYPHGRDGKGFFSKKNVNLSQKTGLSDEYEAQKEVMQYRFPLKFLWMWANKDKVLHPYSLMAFRNFLQTEYAKDVIHKVDTELTASGVTKKAIDDFVKIWTKVSEKILQDVFDDFEKKTDDEKRVLIFELSKLISVIMTEEPDIKNIKDLLTSGNRAVILWGPPGTGKTYESERVVKELLEIKEDEAMEDYRFSLNTANEKGCYEIVQFHPNYTYQDFIGGIAPKLDGENIAYTLKEGIFKRFCDAAAKNADKPYVFIIDEINRAELSAVFGELLYALEYRGKPINLPNFDQPFVIPENVFIIGTMNNVDKSLVTFDLALRRRFGFFKLMPNLDILYILSDSVEEDSVEQFIEKCKTLNENIEKMLDLGEDYHIGQAYFLKIRDFLPQPETEVTDDTAQYQKPSITSFDLEKLWVYHLQPLLEEYLGTKIEDSEIENRLKNLKNEFIQ